MAGSSWKEFLEELGLPLGPPRPPPRAFDDRRARQAIELAAREDLDQTEREALAGWLSAFRHHWPERFAETLGQDGERALRRFQDGVDRNRYLKLRRIALENLASVL